MNVLTAALATGLLAVTILLALIALYLLVLTALAVVFGRGARARELTVAPPAAHRFAILIPAHNEELLIGRLLDNLARLEYPRVHFDVHVVADNCFDRTAEIAQANGAIVHERFDANLKAKGFALRWLLERLHTAGRAYDAFVVLDADSVVQPNFLSVMDARLASGNQVIQAYYSVLNVGQSAMSSLRYAALAGLHFIRPLGRSVVGLSCGLKGNGMCFAAPVLNEFGWDWFTLAEDVEFHLALVRRGIRVDFAPETWVLADMPVTLAQATSQNERWERGRVQMLRQQVLPLLAEGLRARSLLRIDAAVEQLIPPLSVPVALGGVCLLAGLVSGALLTAGLAGLALLGFLGHLLVGLAVVGAPRAAFVALAYAPVYVIWKVGLYARALVSARTTRWIRTVRTA